MPESTPPVRDTPERFTLPLLTLITEQAMDEDYASAAARRSEAVTPRSGRSKILTCAAVAVFGIMLSVAAAQTTRNAEANEANRASLIERVDKRRDQFADQQQRIASLRAGNNRTQRLVTQVVSQAQSADQRRRALQVRTGFIKVRGEGVRITVEDAPDAGPDDVVRDSDLALLTNALWAAGAEAISINGQRLTAKSAIRNSGTPIKVNGQGIAPPYTVLGIGDTRTLQADLLDTASGREFDLLARTFGFRYQMENVARLSLPAAPERLTGLRTVKPSSTDVDSLGTQP